MTEPWLRDLAAADEAEALTAALVSYRCYPGEAGPVQRHVAAWLEAAGLRPELQPTEGDRPNVVARVEKAASAARNRSRPADRLTNISDDKARS